MSQYNRMVQTECALLRRRAVELVIPQHSEMNAVNDLVEANTFIGAGQRINASQVRDELNAYEGYHWFSTDFIPIFDVTFSIIIVSARILFQQDAPSRLYPHAKTDSAIVQLCS